LPAIDLSALPERTRDEAQRRVMIQLKEVLDRVELPPSDQIPDAVMMKSWGKSRWVIPKTEIAVQQIESGPRKGDYTFAADSIERLPAFYAAAKTLPYVTKTTQGWYEKQQLFPIGPMLLLSRIVPARWFLNELTLRASRIVILGQPLWRWIAIIIHTAVTFWLGRKLFRLSQNLQKSTAEPSGWPNLIKPLTVVGLSVISARLLGDILRISDEVFQTVIPSLWGVYFLALSWLFWNLGGVISETIIASEHMIHGSINSQLIRFVTRLISFILVITTLVIGGQSLGLPAYSIIASVGVGGLAVALAAQHTIANLLASLIIYFEKPFIIGSRVVAGGQTGTVLAIGFRSTKIEASNGAIISIPNDKMISGPIEADYSTPKNDVTATLVIHQATPASKIRDFLTAARQFLSTENSVLAESIFVGLSGLRDEWIEIRIKFELSGPYGVQVDERKDSLLLSLLDLGHEAGVTAPKS
jgi:MscS family membrane protein